MEARRSAKRCVVFHETYSLLLMASPLNASVDWRYRHRRFVVGGEHRIMCVQPGELHAYLEKGPPTDCIALKVGDGLMKSTAAELGWPFAELNIRWEASDLQHPDMVRALEALRARLCKTLFADEEVPGARVSCTCSRCPGPLFEALGGIVSVLIERYAQSARDVTLPEAGPAVVRRAKDYLNANYREPYNLDRLAAETGCGKYYLSHLFKRELGVSPSQYLSHLLVSKTCEALTRFPDWPLDRIVKHVGWPSQSPSERDPERVKVMIRHFRKTIGVTPDRFRAPLKGPESASRLSD
jgi:AraC-like DNA-binding protein